MTAFSELYAQTYNKVYNYARHYLRDEFAAQDAVHVGLLDGGLPVLFGDGPDDGHGQKRDGGEDAHLDPDAGVSHSGEQGGEAAGAEPDGDQTGGEALHTGEDHQQDQPQHGITQAQQGMPPFVAAEVPRAFLPCAMAVSYHILK